MSTQKGAVPALRLSMPAVPPTWHFLGGIPGLYHCDFAVPLETLGVDEAQAKKWSRAKNVPLELVQVTQSEADDATAAYREATGEAAQATALAAAGVETAAERSRVSEQIDALKGKDAGRELGEDSTEGAAPEGDNPDPPKEG